MAYEHLQSRLVHEKEQLLRRIKRGESADLHTNVRDELSELSVLDNHPADVATETFLRGMSVGDAVRDEAHLNDIEQALKAIDSNTYGTCAKCGQTIPDDRLDALPTALYCATCQRETEAARNLLKRPVEEDVLKPGFGMSMRDGFDETGFDGEDTWQAVERFNLLEHQDTNGDQMFLDDNNGIVDDVDAYSEREYQEGLPPSPKYRP